MNYKLFLLSVAFVFVSTFSFAQTYHNEFSLQTDNDSYLLQGGDNYYTDGLFLSYRHALKFKDDNGTALQNKILGFELGQKIYNPQTGKIPAAKFVDRPFAGYLYAGASLNLLYKNEGALKLSAQVGVVGPASGAAGAQNFIHNTFGFYTVEGWKYQINDEAELNLSAEYNKLLTRGKSTDLSLSVYGNLGNGFTGAGIGPLFRWGAFNQLFNSASTQSTAIAVNKVAPLHSREFFFYYKPQFNYVGYDATIQGGLFESKSVKDTTTEVTAIPRHVIFSNEFGVAYTTKRWVLNYAAIFHSREVKAMIYRHQWGSITATYRFN